MTKIWTKSKKRGLEAAPDGTRMQRTLSWSSTAQMSWKDSIETF